MELRREYFLFFLSPLLLVVIGVGLLQILGQGGRPHRSEERKGELLLQEVLDLVDREYVVHTDSEGLTYGAAKGIARSLDRYCRVYEKDEWDSRRKKDAGEYDGIGIQTHVLRGFVTAIKVGRDGPAWRAGMRDGDVILEVDGWKVGRKPVLRGVLERMQGPPATEVKILLRDFYGSQPRQVTIVRGTASSESVYGEILDGHPGVGYVRIETFNDNTDDQFESVLRRVAATGLEAMVLDLRGNHGGSLPVSVAIADRFLRGGRVVTMVGRHGTEPYVAHDSRSDLKIPLVVLVDQGTASAAEVVAGALHDHGRAVLVGARTFGKGVVQGIFRFRYGAGGMKLTTAHYLTPASLCIEKELALGGGRKRRGGLRPDLPIPLSKLERGYAMELADRRRYQPFIRRALAEEDRSLPREFKDSQLARALALLAGIDDDIPTEE